LEVGQILSLMPQGTLCIAIEFPSPVDTVVIFFSSRLRASLGALILFFLSFGFSIASSSPSSSS
jgi:hypothetical protein